MESIAAMMGFGSGVLVNVLATQMIRGVPVVAGAVNPLATADGLVDIVVTSDGRQVYQLLGLKRTISVYSVGSSASLSLLQKATGLLPLTNIEGIVSVDRRVA